MRIDSHQHFWQYDPVEHNWMTAAMGGLKHDFLPEDLEPLLAQVGVQGTVAVQARQSLEETDWLLALADQSEFICGVVGWVDLRSPQVEAQLEKYARHPKFKGVRHVVHDEPDDRFMLEPAFLHGLSLLGDLNLSYDLLLFPRHLPVAVEVVRQFPQQRFVLDHIAKPLIAQQVVAPWEADIRALARFANVSCKVSGMVTEAVWGQWRSENFKPYLDIVFDCFGVDRLMFGSDWPVCTLSASYPAVLAIVQDYLRQFPAPVQEKILGQNVVNFYRISFQ